MGGFVYDRGFSGGNAATCSDVIDTSGVSNPAPQAVYQTCRSGSFSYNLSGLMAGASYTVALDFADSGYSAAGQQQFNVGINGTQVLTNFDIFASAGGKDKANRQTFTATADANGQIAVAFNSGSSGTPQVNGIEVLSGSTVVQAINCGQMAWGTITINPSNLTNQGSLQASHGETLTLNNTWSDATGSTITASGATLNLGDQQSNSTNHWSNAGTITAANSTVNLGGVFTVVGLGTFNCTGSSVNLVGTLDNTGTTLALNAATGSWNLASGTLKNGTLNESGGAELLFTSRGARWTE